MEVGGTFARGRLSGGFGGRLGLGSVLDCGPAWIGVLRELGSVLTWGPS